MWNAAVALAPQADPFCCRSEWQLAFREVFAPNQRVLFRKRGSSCIVFAQVEMRDAALLMPIESSWQFGCPLLGPDAIDLLREQLATLTGNRPTHLLISGVVPDSAFAHALATRLYNHLPPVTVHEETLCSASLAGGLDGYLSRRSPHTRRNVRAAARRAADCSVTFERCAPTDAASAHSAYTRMLAVERRSWKGIGMCGMTMPPSREFYAVLLERLASSRLARVVFARRDDRDIGFVLGGLANGVYRGQQFSYDEHWAPFSIGNLLQLEQLRWLCEEGAHRYDMGPLMDYKPRWTELRTRSETWLLRTR